jgi:hypothetical protein
MPETVMSKSAFAAHLGRSRACISHWLKRKQLTSPAVTADGRINVSLALEQLQTTIDLPTSVRRQPQPAPVADPVSATRTPLETAQAQLISARALMATVQAERERRQLNEERGRYVLADAVRAEFSKVLREFIEDVETSLIEVAAELGVDREGLLILRRWWKQRRERMAEKARIMRDSSPKYVADPAD